MKISDFKHNPDKVKAVLKETNDGSLITLKPLKIYIPAAFEERELANIGQETNIVGICAYVLEDNSYAISMINAMLRIEPTSIKKVDIEEELYYEFLFQPGDKVIASLDLVKNNILTYLIYNQIISKAHVPWYLNYDALAELFDTASEHAGASVGDTPEITELLVSIIARDDKDLTRYYRQSIKNAADIEKSPPAFISMNSVQYAATNTTNKLGGSYFSEGVVSALVNPSERKERVESILME